MERSDQPLLAPRDLLVLAVLSESPLHGYGIIRAVDHRTGSSVFLDPANLYRALRRMRRDGWIQPSAASTGRKKVFELTSLGRSVLDAETRRLAELLQHTRPGLSPST